MLINKYISVTNIMSLYEQLKNYTTYMYTVRYEYEIYFAWHGCCFAQHTQYKENIVTLTPWLCGLPVGTGGVLFAHLLCRRPLFNF